jgi:hypothetical protein
VSWIICRRWNRDSMRRFSMLIRGSMAYRES